MAFTQEQLVERRGFLGASECASALGESPFFSQVALYLDKIGEGEPIEKTLPMLVGQALEPVTLELFTRETQLTVTDHQRQYTDPSCKWRRCTVDGMAHDGWIVEAKSSGDFRGWGDGGDEVPLQYLYNAHHSLACVSDAPGVYIPVVIGGRTYRTYVIRRDPDLVDMVRKGEAAFMDLVKKRRPPQPKDREDVFLLYPKSNEMFVQGNETIMGKVRDHARAKAEAKGLEARIELLARDITAFMGAAGTLKRMVLGGPGEIMATWNSQERRTIDADALRANYPDIAKTVTKVTPTRVFLNKVKA
jgi:predicted phage-related endonuclease